jgi:large subunit ribosomal protein L5
VADKKQAQVTENEATDKKAAASSKAAKPAEAKEKAVKEAPKAEKPVKAEKEDAKEKKAPAKETAKAAPVKEAKEEKAPAKEVKADKVPVKEVKAEEKAPAKEAKPENKAPVKEVKAEEKAPAKEAKPEIKAPAKDAGAKADKKPEAAKADKAAKVAPEKFVKKNMDLNRYRVRKLYLEKAVPALIKKFGYKNINEVPKFEKVTLNMGLGADKDNSKSFQLALEEMKQIAGQKPVVTTAKKSVANFKVRKGMSIGAKVTLRGGRMYDFIDKFINIVLPRVRDFRGVSAKSFDGRGNYAIGVKEQLIFPEITYDQIEKVRGLDICIVTTAKTDEEARELLTLIGMPFTR